MKRGASKIELDKMLYRSGKGYDFLPHHKPTMGEYRLMIGRQMDRTDFRGEHIYFGKDNKFPD